MELTDEDWKNYDNYMNNARIYDDEDDVESID